MQRLIPSRLATVAICAVCVLALVAATIIWAPWRDRSGRGDIADPPGAWQQADAPSPGISVDSAVRTEGGVAYRHAGDGTVELRGTVRATLAPARQLTSSTSVVPLFVTRCGWRPQTRSATKIRASLTGGRTVPAHLQIDLTGFVSLTFSPADAISLPGGLPGFTGAVDVDAVRFDADASPQCASGAVPVPAGRYRKAVFDRVTAHPAETFTDSFVSDARGPRGSSIDDLRFERFEPSPGSDPMYAKRKAVVILYGGGFATPRKDVFRQQRAAAMAWARAGWVAFTVEYPTYPELADMAEAQFRAFVRPVMEDSVRATLTFWRYMAEHAIPWGIDMDATVLTGWSASGVTAIESLADHYRTVEGFEQVPKVRIALSADWVPGTPDEVGRPRVDPPFVPVLNTRNDPSLLIIHFAADLGYGDDGSTAFYDRDCAAITDTRAKPGHKLCEQRVLPGSGHRLVLQPAGTVDRETGERVTDCFRGRRAADGCSVLDAVLAYADDATP